MKKYYKVKKENKTKLKSYLNNADKQNNTRSRAGSVSKHHSPKRNNL